MANIGIKQVPINRFILNIEDPKVLVDHKSGSWFNNLESNLRPSTKSQNAMNQQNQEGTSSKYKGVCWHAPSKKWRAYIKINGKQIHLGYFNTEIEAARAYNKAALELFGEFANLNIIEEDK